MLQIRHTGGSRYPVNARSRPQGGTVFYWMPGQARHDNKACVGGNCCRIRNTYLVVVVATRPDSYRF